VSVLGFAEHHQQLEDSHTDAELMHCLVVCSGQFETVAPCVNKDASGTPPEEATLLEGAKENWEPTPGVSLGARDAFQEILPQRL
jgi:hypothetical protein